MTKTISIAGAGVIGLTIAHVLSGAGHNVTIFDPAGFPVDNASMQAGGMLAPYGEAEYLHGDWLHAGLEGVAFWRDMHANHDIGFRASGSYYAAHKNDAYMFDRFMGHVPEQAHAQSVQNNIFGAFAKKAFIQNEAHLDPHKVLHVLSSNENITYYTHAFDFDNESDCDHIIDTRGIAAQNDFTDLRAVKGEAIIVRNTEYMLDAPVRVMHPRYTLYVVPRDGGEFYIGATEIETDDADNTMSVRSMMELLSALHILHPSFAEAEIVRTISRLRPAFPDNLPRIIQNGKTIHCNGIFRHGYLLSPAIAMVVKDMVDGRDHPLYTLLTRS